MPPGCFGTAGTRVGLDAGEYLRLYYNSEDSLWIDIWNVEGGSSDSSFIFVNATLPGAALHEDFRFRIAIYPGGNTNDDVYIDDVEMRAMVRPNNIQVENVIFGDSFPASTLDLEKWPGSSYTGISGSYYTSAPYSCNLDSSEQLVSKTMDFSQILFTVSGSFHGIRPTQTSA